MILKKIKCCVNIDLVMDCVVYKNVVEKYLV